MDTKMDLINKLNNSDLTLEEKLAKIEEAMQEAQVEHKKANPLAAPLDPSLLNICDGCE